jgi:hypothetical protein
VLQLTSEKDRGVARLQEERERAERDQQAALAEAVKGQATLRAELAATLQRVKVRCAVLPLSVLSPGGSVV